MTIGIITGSGTHALPGFEDPDEHIVGTAAGEVPVTRGRIADVDIVHLSRHGEGHRRLSSHVAFRANALAMQGEGVRAVIGFTVCGSTDPSLAPGSVIVFDDLYFPVNRLPDGTACTMFSHPGEAGRGHWIFDAPFSEELRAALTTACRVRSLPVQAGGTYGHVDGPRFNTRSEISQMAQAGVVAVSQTGGPETVLFGELEIPYALVGFVTDLANGVSPVHTPIEELTRLMGVSREVFGALVAAAAPLVPAAPPAVGTVYRWD